MRTEREKMLSGELYTASDPELTRLRIEARALWQRLNGLSAEDLEGRQSILRGLLGTLGEDVLVEPPFFCDYGRNIHLARGVYLNMNCTFLDPAPITIGAQTFLGPGVQLYTASHPIDARERAAGPELALPITIGARVWIGGASVVCPGVTIGDDSIVGAGSVVTRDVASGVIVAGSPSRVIRTLP